MTRRSYYGPDPEWWPVIAEGLARPWSREAIMHDLCWWADQERVGRRVRPGRPALCARWGVTGHAARTLMRDEDAWGDPAHRRQPTASASPADRQPTASRPPAAATTNADNGAETASRPPADRQRVASASPAGRPTRGVDTDTLTLTATLTEETHASQPAAEETAWASSSSQTPSVEPAATCSPSPTLPPSAAERAESASIAPPATTAHPVTVSGRPPVAGSGDDALAVAWATARMQRLDPTRVSLDRSDVRAIERATRDGCTLADLEAIGAWLETPAADWWQGKGYAVAGWRQLLGVDGVKWRDRLRDTQAREPRTVGRVTATQAGAGFADALRRLIDDEQGEIIDIRGGYDGEQERDREGVRAVAAGGSGSPRRLVDRARAGG